MTLTFGFLRSNIEIALVQEWMGPNLFETFRDENKKMIVKAVNGGMGKN